MKTATATKKKAPTTRVKHKPRKHKPPVRPSGGGGEGDPVVIDPGPGIKP